MGQVVDSKIKEADHFLDEKREEVVKQVQDATSKATGQAEQGIGSVLGKAKGLLNCESRTRVVLLWNILLQSHKY